MHRFLLKHVICAKQRKQLILVLFTFTITKNVKSNIMQYAEIYYLKCFLSFMAFVVRVQVKELLHSCRKLVLSILLGMRVTCDNPE